MKTIEINGTLTALSPIYHGGEEKTGAQTKLRREIFFVNGKQHDIPVISGNAIRGILRRLIFKDLMERVGLGAPTDKQIHTLLSGGILESVDEKTSGSLDIADRKKFASIPPISLFGMSFGNQIFDGKLKVSQVLPICAELKDRTGIETETKIYTFLDNYFFTRKDEIRNRQEDEQAVQMMVQNEIFIPGTMFVHKFVLEDTTDLEDSCFAQVLDLFKQRPYIGGKSSTGFGEVLVKYDCPYREGDYIQHVTDNAKEIKAILELI